MKSSIQANLKNIHGLKVVKVHDPVATSASIQIWFAAGSACETKEEKGIAHFLEHMFFKGTEQYPGNKLTAELEKMGSEVNAFTSFDYTCYYVNCPQSGILECLERMIDMVSNPLFLEKDLQSEIGVVQEEYKRSFDSPSQFHFHQLQEHFFKPPYHYPILGKPSDIASFTIDKIKNFRNKYYHAGSTLIVIAGNLKGLDGGIDKKLKLQKIPKKKGKVDQKQASFALNKIPRPFLHHKKSVQQVNLQILIPGHAYDTKEAPLEEIAINFLSSGESSYLHKKLVQELEVANSISGSTMYLKGGATHFLRASISTDKFLDFQKAWPQVWEELAHNDLVEEEIQKIKNQFYASKIYEKESLESYAFTLGHNYIFTGNLLGDDSFLKRVKDAKLIDVKKQLNSLVKKTWSFSLQTPMKFDDKLIAPFSSEINKYSVNLLKEKKHTPIKKKTFERVELFTLTDQLQVFYRYNPKTPTFSLHSLIDGGIINETKATNGHYQMLSRMLSLEHKKKDYDSLQWELEFLAASINGYTGKNSYGLSMYGLTEHWDKLFENYLLCLKYPKFSQGQFDIQKNILLQTLKNITEDPAKQCFRNFQNNFFKTHPYGLDSLGNKESLEKLTIEQLQTLHDHSLTQRPITFLFSGDIDPKTFEKTILSRFQKEFSFENKNPLLKMDTAIYQPKAYDSHYYVSMDREQSHIFIGYPSFNATDPKNIFLTILNDFLAGQSSDLFRITRDELGLCYAVHPMANSGLNAGYWGIYIATGEGKEEAALKSIQGILADLGKKGLRADQLADTKTSIAGQQSLKLQTNDDFCNYYSFSTHFKMGLDFESQKLKNLKNVSLEDFNKFMRDFLQKKSLTVCVGRKNPWP
ncbi:MAG: pitrilysin family protein [Bacteriovoracaceae bacterium]|nr:pitrilysin family protein [Bacteriovoracaceae bacterium]